MTSILFQLLLAAPTVVHAQNHEVSLNTGFIGTQDENWEKIQFNRTVPGAGLSLGTRVGENLSGLVSFQTGTVGTRIFIDEEGGDNGDEWTAWDEPSFNIAATVDQYAVGAKWRIQWRPRFTSTLTGSAIVAHGRLRMDEDIEMEGSEVELKYVSVKPGAAIGTGIEYAPVSLPNKSVLFTIGAELGYAYIAPLNFKDQDSAQDPLDIGKLDMHGAYMRWSVGARF